MKLVVFAAVASAVQGCQEVPAPSTVSVTGLISNGAMWMNTNAPNLTADCLPTFFSGDTDIFQVADRCCTTEVGSFEWIPFGDFDVDGSHSDTGATWTGRTGGIDGCMTLDPFGNGANGAVIVNGCYENGTQFYGEKCGGSSFTAAPASVVYGSCGEASATCGCKLYVTSSTTGCYAIASPNEAQNAVYAKFEGCGNPGNSGANRALPFSLVFAAAKALLN